MYTQNQFEHVMRGLRSHAENAIVIIPRCESEKTTGGLQGYRLSTESIYASSLNKLKSSLDMIDFQTTQSLFATPSLPLEHRERLMHRIWLGGHPPATAIRAINQWATLLGQVSERAHLTWECLLWVWDEQQLHADPAFVPQQFGQTTLIGHYRTAGAGQRVHSLRRLVQNTQPELIPVLENLLASGYYVNLSDYFRILILHELGGMYLDADTIPHPACLPFLAKPAVPDLHLQYGADQHARRHISWLNLYQDENGGLISKSGNAALGQLRLRMQHFLSSLPACLPRASRTDPVARQFSRLLHDASYGIWRDEMARSFISLDQLYRHTSPWASSDTEPVLIGIKGMRLQVDAVTGEQCPLDHAEQENYQACIDLLAARAWQLDDPLDLAACCEPIVVMETPRLAYHPQLRSIEGHCHYYSFLSEDPNLDRVNALFCAYMIARNDSHFYPERGGHATAFKQPLRVRPSQTGQPIFLPGTDATSAIRDRMAALLFDTSYLEYCSFGNVLHLPFIQLQRRQNIDPYISCSHLLFATDGQFAGFFTAATLDTFAGLAGPSYYRPEMREMDAAYDAFVAAHTEPDDLFVSSLAIESTFRGQGLFNIMLDEMRERARRLHCRRIVLTVWEHSDAYQVYLSKGFYQTGLFGDAYPVFYDRLHMMALPVTQSCSSGVPVTYVRDIPAPVQTAPECA
ncbi:GNAT family N-acetyltransferase [Burkholderiaceae bacterium DAT-1]|nr:GNAT family N-acetyltransferase [Burkholderiaceae bacterium DAT-1]